MTNAASYYDHFGFIYEPLWGENIHWGLFPHGDESLSDATEMYRRAGRVAFSARSRATRSSMWGRAQDLRPGT